MPTFLHLPFELQSHILRSAFHDALTTDLSSRPARPLSSRQPYHPSIQKSSFFHLLSLSPMHQTTSTHDLFTQLLPLTISPCISDTNSDTNGDTNSEASNDADASNENNSSTDTEPPLLNHNDDLTISPNQLIHCLRQSQNQLRAETDATKLGMREIVFEQPWARAAGETYCLLWRRKERAEVVGEVIEAALRVCLGCGVFEFDG